MQFSNWQILVLMLIFILGWEGQCPAVLPPSYEGLCAASGLQSPATLPDLNSAAHHEGLESREDIKGFLSHHPVSHHNVGEYADWTSDSESEGMSSSEEGLHKL